MGVEFFLLAFVLLIGGDALSKYGVRSNRSTAQIIGVLGMIGGACVVVGVVSDVLRASVPDLPESEQSLGRWAAIIVPPLMVVIIILTAYFRIRSNKKD